MVLKGDSGAERTHRGERGAILVMAAILMIAMMGVAAVAIDVSNARQVQRQARGTADAASLAGAQDLPSGIDVVATVKAYSADNLDASTSVIVTDSITTSSLGRSPPPV